MKELIYKKSFENKKILKNIFIPSEKKWISTENNNLSVIESGKNGLLFHKIIADIELAQEMICLQSFLIQDTQIIDALLKAKQERDVRVFIMGCAEAKLESNPYEEEDSFITKGYKTMLEEKFKNNFVHRQAGNLHAKFILIDPKTNPKGYIFTGNFNKKPFFENPELALALTEEQVTELFHVYVYHFWEHTTDEQTENSQFDKLHPINKFNLPPLTHILLTSPNPKISNLNSTLLEAISRTEKELQFSTFGLDISHKLVQTILEKLNKGVAITIYCRPRLKAIKNNIELLARNGAKVICHDLIHAKSLIVDKKEAYIFSANFETHGMDTGFEVGVKLNINQKNDLLYIYDTWKNTFPYEYFYEKKLIEINSYQELDGDGRLNKILTIKEEEIKRNTKKVITVNDLLTFLSIKEPKDLKSKINTIVSVAQLETIDKKSVKIKTVTNDVDLIEIEIVSDKKQKSEKVLLLNIKEENDISSLLSTLEKDYKNFKIYAK